MKIPSVLNFLGDRGEYSPAIRNTGCEVRILDTKVKTRKKFDPLKSMKKVWQDKHFSKIYSFWYRFESRQYYRQLRDELPT